MPVDRSSSWTARRGIAVGVVAVFLVGAATACVDETETRGRGSGSDVGGVDTGGQAGYDVGMRDAGDDARSGSSDGVESGLDETREAAGLTHQERIQVCQAGLDYVGEQLTTDDYCLWATHRQVFVERQPESDEQASQMCEQLYQQWQEQAQETKEDDSREGTCEQMPETAGADCTIDVGTWENCEEALTDGFAAYVDGLPACSEVTLSYYNNDYQFYAPESSEEREAPEACEPVRDECPNLYSTWVGPIKQR